MHYYIIFRYSRNISELENLPGDGNITLSYDHYKDEFKMTGKKIDIEFHIFLNGTMIHHFKFYRQRIIGSGEDGGS